ncbi:MAG: glutamine-hydrolyzing GMP synthase [Desulfurococcaceae archaeon]
MKRYRFKLLLKIAVYMTIPESHLYIPGSTVLVVDYGGQYTHLIARRLRELGVYAEIIPYYRIGELDLHAYSAIVLSGSHRHVRETDPHIYGSVRKVVFETDKPVLGICFGHQLIASMLGGNVRSNCGEYGRTRIKILRENAIFSGWATEETVWMSHGDCVVELPENANTTVLAISENNYIAAFKAMVNNRPVYGVQFHPEVVHTPKGMVLFNNLIEMFRIGRMWRSEYYLEYILDMLRKKASDGGKALVAVSGGVDSTVSAMLVKKVFGDRLIAVFVDHGLFREGEPEEVVSQLRGVGLEPWVIDARERFLSRLENVVDCEERRVIIGEEFARIFSEIIDSENIRFFVQGTTYPDVVESGATKVADRIKSHHNVGGLPDWFRDKVEIIEPLRYLYKDEVRRLGSLLGLPEYFVKRHPFPGPGLAVRVIGRFTREKLEICRKASRIVEDVLKEHGYYDKVWQAFAVVGDDKWVGVKGDARKHGYVVSVRVVESVDGMTADYAKLPYDVLDEIARRILNTMDNVVMVTYAITSKPPSTIEPC